MFNNFKDGSGHHCMPKYECKDEFGSRRILKINTELARNQKITRVALCHRSEFKNNTSHYSHAIAAAPDSPATPDSICSSSMHSFQSSAYSMQSNLSNQSSININIRWNQLRKKPVREIRTKTAQKSSQSQSHEIKKRKLSLHSLNKYSIYQTELNKEIKETHRNIEILSISIDRLTPAYQQVEYELKRFAQYQQCNIHISVSKSIVLHQTIIYNRMQTFIKSLQQNQVHLNNLQREYQIITNFVKNGPQIIQL